MAVDVRIPELGESITDGVIVRWLKQEGDEVRVDDALLELETDKATIEIPATAAGRLQIVEREGATVRIGAVVARIAAGAEGADGSGADPASATAVTPEPQKAAREERPSKPVARPDARPTARASDAEPAHASAATSDAKKSGEAPRDIAERAAARVEAPADDPAPEASAPAAAQAPAAEPARAKARDDGDVERTPMSRLRRRIAERLVEAQRTAAILTTFNEVDLSRLLDVRRRLREHFRERHGVDLGLVSLFGRACVQALADVPILNARIDGADVVQPRRVHLGIAVSTSRGLVVPVIRDADRMTLAELERAIGDLAGHAREGTLTPGQLAGGTFTITNGGVFGSLLSTPILNPPQSGILGMHKIEERPVALNGEVVIRSMMYVALSYDHRLVDGEQAVTFLVRVKERLEDPVRMLFEV